MLARTLLLISVAVFGSFQSNALAQGRAQTPPTAQRGPSTSVAPATAPTTRPRQLVTIPPGFKVIKIKGYSVILEPLDEAMATDAINQLKPTTRPSTMPSDLLGTLKQKREEIKKRLTTDMALADASIAEKFLAESLEPAIKRLDDLRSPLFYLLTSEQRLKEVLKAGWSDSRFYYNRVADAVQLNLNLRLSFGPDADELLLPAVYNPDAAAEAKRQRLVESIQGAEGMVMSEISGRSMIETEAGFLNFVNEQAVKPMTLKRDQEWLGLGIRSVLSSQYVEMVCGFKASDMLRNMSTDNPQNPMRSAPIDLLHPNEATAMKPEMIPYYADAYRRKAIRVVYVWYQKVGNQGLAKLIAEVRKTPSADGPALLKQIQQATGVDLTNDVKPGG